MLAQKLLHSSRKQLLSKQPYKKPVYKSYKELLHLDRPRQQIQYESSSSDEDFLEKLLNEEKQSRKKKKKSVKSGKRKLDTPAGQENKGSIGEFKLIRNTQSRERSAQKRNTNELSLIQEQKNIENKVQPIVVKFNDESKSLKKQQSSLPHKKSIYIDNQSIQSTPILYTTTNHLFQATLTQKRQTPSFLLLEEKAKFLSLSKPKENLDTIINGNKIEHAIDKILQDKFKFKPNIEPILHNWRLNLNFHPKKIIPQREFVDRKTLFKNKEQEQKFVQSLRQISRKKY